MAQLEVHDLSVEFSVEGGPLQAVRGISFALTQGKTLALIGESGSGKSVTSRAIMGILAGNARIRGGSIRLDGQELRLLSEKEMAVLRGSRLAMVFQDPMSSLDPVMRVGRQITEVITVKQGVSARRAKEKALQLLQEVGIPDSARCFLQFPHQLSGGMRQRVVIAIALAADPQILICDEPTTALDVTVQAQILELLQRLQRQRGLSILLITHDFGVVAQMAQEVAVMYAGKIVEYGKAEEIFYAPCHPYTRALLRATPDLHSSQRLYAIPGAMPDMRKPPVGDAFAARDPEAMAIDFERQPPPFYVSDSHWAATWRLHPLAQRGGSNGG